MRIEDKVVSLETAKKLKEAGFPQETERWWAREAFTDERGGLTVGWRVSYHKGFSYVRSNGEEVAAPDTQETGELLPATVDGKYGDCTRWFNSRRTQEWHVWYENGRKDEELIFSHANEAEARAAAWLWLRQNDLL